VDLVCQKYNSLIYENRVTWLKASWSRSSAEVSRQSNEVSDRCETKCGVMSISYMVQRHCGNEIPAESERGREERDVYIYKLETTKLEEDRRTKRQITEEKSGKSGISAHGSQRRHVTGLSGRTRKLR
jgi:hypothetical protein